MSHWLPARVGRRVDLAVIAVAALPLVERVVLLTLPVPPLVGGFVGPMPQ